MFNSPLIPLPSLDIFCTFFSLTIFYSNFESFLSVYIISLQYNFHSNSIVSVLILVFPVFPIFPNFLFFWFLQFFRWRVSCRVHRVQRNNLGKSVNYDREEVEKEKENRKIENVEKLEILEKLKWGEIL